MISDDRFVPVLCSAKARKMIFQQCTVTTLVLSLLLKLSTRDEPRCTLGFKVIGR